MCKRRNNQNWLSVSRKERTCVILQIHSTGLHHHFVQKRFVACDHSIIFRSQRKDELRTVMTNSHLMSGEWPFQIGEIWDILRRTDQDEVHPDFPFIPGNSILKAWSIAVPYFLTHSSTRIRSTEVESFDGRNLNSSSISCPSFFFEKWMDCCLPWLLFLEDILTCCLDDCFHIRRFPCSEILCLL